MKRVLEVINRPLRYNTRRLLPGDEFLAQDRFARVLVAMRRAREPRALADIPPPPPALIAKVASPFDHDCDGYEGGSLPAAERGLDDLRAEAEQLGIKVDLRWGQKRLEAEIAKAQTA